MDAAIDDQGHVVGVFVGLFQVLGGQKNSDSFLPVQSGDDLPEQGPGQRVHANGWFIEEKNGGFVYQGQGAVQAAFVTSGQVGGPFITHWLQVKQVDQFLCPLVGLRFTHPE
ncbi:MAG: hypothetical protein BWY72_02457 [Bacteroidetes bacterium ADurb.Bin416]|nr:MAG: hypothetical protein BWY72_02457 [Bacteroidetes bacterium ADurb.Bin416]